MLSYETYLNLIRHLDDLVAAFEQHPDAATREQAGALLSGLDALHREGLTRLIGALREAGAGTLVDQAAADPVVATLLGLYDLGDLDLPAEASPPAAFIPLDNLRRKPSRGVAGD